MQRPVAPAAAVAASVGRADGVVSWPLQRPVAPAAAVAAARAVALDVTWSCNRYSNVALDVARARDVAVAGPVT